MLQLGPEEMTLCFTEKHLIDLRELLRFERSGPRL